MKRIGIFAKRHQKDAVRLAKEVVAWLGERKIEVCVDEPLAEAMDGVRGYPGKAIPPLVDLIVVLGGDNVTMHITRTLAGLREQPSRVVDVTATSLETVDAAARALGL